MVRTSTGSPRSSVMKRSYCALRIRHLIRLAEKPLAAVRIPSLRCSIHTSSRNGTKNDENKPKWYDLWPQDHLVEQKQLIERETSYFESTAEQSKATFQAAVHRYLRLQGKQRRGHVEFIRAALGQMKTYGVHRDITVYSLLLTLFPVGIMVAQNAWQVDMMHYPKQQDCCIELLEQMEVNGVIPNDAMGDQLKAIFGVEVHAFRKYRRMMYWLPKFKNANPYYVPYDVPEDATELAIMALKRMAVDLQNQVTVFQSSELDTAVDHTFVVSAQAPTQKELVAEHPKDKPVFVEGGFQVWLRGKRLTYFVLRSDVTSKYTRFQESEEKGDDESFLHWSFYSSSFEMPRPSSIAVAPSEHEQGDGTILAMCITGTSSKDSLISWTRFLQKTNPVLAEIPIMFQLQNLPEAIERWSGTPNVATS